MHSQNYKFTYVKPVSGLKRHVDATFFRLGKSTPLAVILFCGLIFLGSVTAFAQITVGTTSSDFSIGSTTLSFSHTPGAGSNKLLLVAVGVGGTTNPGPIPPPTVTSVTFNGTPLSQVEEAYGRETRDYIFSLVNPPAGPFNVVVTISNSTNVRIQASATTFMGVNQTTPLGNPVKVESNASTGSISLTVSSTTVDDIIYSTTTVDEGGQDAQSITAGGGQTSLWNDSGSDFVSSASSYKAGAAGSTTSTYTFFEASDHSGIAVAIKGIVCTLPNCGSVTLTKI